MNNTVVNDLARVLAESLAAGQTHARASFGAKNEAFAYVGPIMSGLVAAVSSAPSESRSFTALHVSHVADVTAWTTGQKPVTATITPEAVALAMYPGVVEIKTADAIDSASLGTAISTTLLGQAVRALDKDVITDLLTLPGVDAAADLAGIAAGQALVMGKGFSPDVVAVSPTVYATLASTSLVSGGGDPATPKQYVLGSRLVVSTALTGAQAIVLDSSAVIAVEHDSSPVALLDVDARNNLTTLVIELVAGHFVTAPDGVCPVWDRTP